MNMQTVIEAAQDIADHNHQEGLVPEIGVGFGEEAITQILNSALQGSGLNGPHMWAVIVDAQSAAQFLDKAEASEAAHHMFQAESYRAVSYRKLTQAVSYLL